MAKLSSDPNMEPLSQRATGEPLLPSEGKQSSVNLNVLLDLASVVISIFEMLVTMQ